MRLLTVGLLVSSIGVVVVIDGFSISPIRSARPFGVSLSVSHRSTQPLWSTTSSEADVTTTVKFETELRAAAMKLHTKKQAREGEAEEAQPASKEPYVPTHDDYLAFLVDSKHVYEAFEEVVNEKPELAVFRNTGLERTKCLEKDIEFMVKEFDLIRPQVGARGKEYAAELRRLSREGTIPEFMCHFYNFYFAHTAGGRMIGKQMSALLLENRTIEFYKWDGDLNSLKAAVKMNIENMAAGWSRQEKDACVGATEAAFRLGGGINSYLSGGRLNH